MSTRPVVSYDDITLPYSFEEVEAAGGSAPGPSSASHASQPPPSKRRKWKNDNSNQRNNKNNSGSGNHTTKNSARGSSNATSAVTIGPAVPPTSSKAGQGRASTGKAQDTAMDGAAGADGAYYEEGEDGEEDLEEESRELTHDEIWDDSALVDAWEAAKEEYEMYHGINNKDWKTLPVNKSPLWFNNPVASSAKTPQTKTGDNAEVDSVPLNFETFVPTHDPSLEAASSGVAAQEQTPQPQKWNGAPMADYAFASPVQGGMASQDEAFTRATSAMYWAGYWTAIYQCQSQNSKQTKPAQTADNDQDEEDEDEEEGEEEDGDLGLGDDGFVSTQR